MAINNLFSSMSGGNVGFGNLAAMLQDYSSIKSGTYKKLLKKYYSMNSDDKTSATTKAKSQPYTIEKRREENTKTSSSTATSSEAAKSLKDIRSATDSLKTDANTLTKSGKGSVFEKVEKKDADGNKTMEYDTDKIYSAVKNFVDSYNSVLDSTANTKVSSIASNTRAMTNSTKAKESALSSIGISIGKDGKLSIDENTFKASDMSDVKSLFHGANSYASQTAARASAINVNAQTEQNRANTYTNSGYYSSNYSNGSLYDSMF